MRSSVHKITAGMLSAALFCGSLSSMPAVYAAETEASAEETFRSMIRNAWENHQTSVSLRSLRLPINTVSDWYYDMLYTDADWFYVDSAFSYSSARGLTGTYVSTLQIKYLYSAKAVPAMQKELDDAITQILAPIDPSWSDAEKVLYLHDYLAEHCEYDLTYENNDAYTALVDGITVCQGYSLAMCILCRMLDIPCYTITSDSLNHMWNVVCVDGEWYHCDSTYDDGAPDMLGHGTHMYLLQSDAVMQDDPYHAADDWNYFSEGQTIKCVSDDYSDAFWVGALDTVQPLPDGSWFYAKAVDPANVRLASQVQTTFCRSTLMNNTEECGTAAAAWPTETGTVYSVCYICTEVSGDRVYYYDTQNIYEMSIDGSDTKTIYTLTEEEKELGYIYGIRLNDDYTLSYQIMKQPAFENADDLRIDATFHSIYVGEPSLPFFTTTTTTDTTTETTVTTTTTTESTTMTTSTTSALNSPWQMELVPPTKLTYTIGEQLDYSGAEASVYIGSSGWEGYYYRIANRPLPDKDFVIDDSAFDSSKEGTYRIYVSYAEDSSVFAYFDVRVEAAAATTTSTTATSKPALTTTTTPKTSATTSKPSATTFKTSATTSKTSATTTKPVTTTQTDSTAPKTTTTAQPTTTTVTTTTSAATKATPSTTTTTTTTTTTITTAPKPVSILPGDVNLDNVVDVSDAVLLARLIAEDVTVRISEQGLINGNCNGDNSLSSDDVIYILRVIAHLI